MVGKDSEFSHWLMDSQFKGDNKLSPYNVIMGFC